MTSIPQGAAPWTGVVALCVGCASSIPPPNDQWAAAQADVGRAQAGGAPDVPDARLHLQLAEEDLQKCRQSIGNDNDRATSLCAVASAEAELALSLSHQAAAEARALHAEGDLQKAAVR
jgi:hypothetical protein